MCAETLYRSYGAGAVLDSCYKHIAPTEQGTCSGFQPR